LWLTKTKIGRIVDQKLKRKLTRNNIIIIIIIIIITVLLFDTHKANTKTLKRHNMIQGVKLALKAQTAFGLYCAFV